MASLLAAFVLAAASGRWTELPRQDAPPPLLQESTYYVGHRLVVVGRNGDHLEGSSFDFDRGHWTRVRPLDLEEVQVPAFITQLPQAHLLGDELLLFFGQRPADPNPRPRPFAAGARYDIRRNLWRPMQREGAVPAAGASLVRWEANRLLVFRAKTDPKGPLGGVGAIYDAEADRWTPIASEQAPRVAPGEIRWNGTYAGGKPLLFGRALGVHAPAQQMNFSYDLRERTWDVLPPGAPRDNSVPIALWRGDHAIVLGAGPDLRELEGGEYDPGTNRWTPIESAVRGRNLFLVGELVACEGCIEGRDESITYLFFHLLSRSWSHTRQRTFQCTNAIVHDEDALVIAETARGFSGWIPVHVYEPERDRWRHGRVAAAGGPVTLGGPQTWELFPDHLHWDGRRLVLWGGANVAKDQPDPCGAQPGPNPACAKSDAPEPVAHTGYWTVPQWQ